MLKKNNFAALISLVFLLVACLGVAHHEMWSDEVHSWLLARDSHSLFELYFNKRYEGHPIVWYLILYALTAVTHNVIVMQYLHVVIATLFVYAWMRWAPFNTWLKIAALFGYYFIYEYTLLSRLYSTELLSLFLVCALYEKKFERPILFAFLLVVAANTVLFGFFIAAGIAGLILLELPKEISSGNFPRQLLQRRKLFIAGLIITGGLAFSLITMIPPADCYFAKGWNNDYSAVHFHNVIGKIWEGFVPIPQHISAWWDTNNMDDSVTKTVYSILVLVIATFSLAKNPRVALMFFLVCTIILVFFFLKHIGFVRHHGQLFIAWLVFLWISQGKKENTSRFFSLVPQIFLGAALAVQIYVGLFAYISDWKYSFSPAEEVADYIKQLPSPYKVVVKNDYTEEPVGAYLDVLPYCPTRQCDCSFFLLTWNGTRVVDVPQTIADSYTIATTKKEKVFLVMEDDYTPPPEQHYIRKIYSSQKDCICDPQMFIYEIDPQQ